MRDQDTENRQKPLKKSKTNHEKPVENSNKKVIQTAKKSKSNTIFTVFGLIGLIGGAGLLAAFFLVPGQTRTAISFAEPDAKTNSGTYSRLTGLKLNSEADVTAPAYCVQTPNGTDGARPQAGLNEAGAVFEAIAESGITRFAAIYQNPASAIIGPIRSLRIYYLEWDTPFDCTIVHAGGSGDALAAVSRGGYKDLTENYEYMYRGTYGSRLWNNLFTTSTYLNKFSSDKGYNTSDIKGFLRMTPDESSVARVNGLVEEKLTIYEASDGKTSSLIAKVPDIAINFGGWATFNVRYNYDLATNTYLRSYGTGEAHEVYACPAGDLGEKNPEDNCTLTQMAPTVVVAMVVQERRASDNYHEDIDAIGSGKAYIFQNGSVVEGTWKKSSAAEQIAFHDAAGAEIKLAPGQTFVEAVPAYGSIEY